MTKKTRNEYIALAVVLLVLVYLLYHFVFGSSNDAPITTNVSILQGATSSNNAGFLPNGPDLNTSVLKDPVFTSLVPLPQFTVSASDLGIANLFSGNPTTPLVVPQGSTATLGQTPIATQ